MGTLTIGADGAFTFTPAAGYAGTVPSATYTLSDGAQTATAVLALAIDRPNLVANGNFTSGPASWTPANMEYASDTSQFGIPLSPTGGNFTELEGYSTGTPGTTNAISQVIATNAGEAYVFSTDAITRSNKHGRQDFLHRRRFDAHDADNDIHLGRLFHVLHGGGGYDHDQPAVAGSVSGVRAGADDGEGGLVDNVQVQELNVTPTGPLAAVEDTQANLTGFKVATNAAGTLTVTLSAANGVLTLAGTTGLTFTTGDGTADPTMTFSGTGRDINAALATLRYTGNANVNGTDTITQTVTSGGTTDTDSVTVNVAAANDAPTGANDSQQVFVNQAATGNVLTNDSDLDGDALAVTQFVWNGVTTAAGGTATNAGVGTLTIAADGAYTFTPAAGYAGAVPSATYTLSDSGGLTATATLSFTLDGVNDAPSGVDRTITVAEDNAYGFTASDFAFTDPNDSPANGLKAVIITTLPTKGTLTLGGVTVSAGQSVLAADLGSLLWRPAANANGTGYASFTFQVVDDGGTANGGVDTDASANTITFNVTPVDDAPLARDDTAQTFENLAVTGNVLLTDTEVDSQSMTMTQFTWGGTTVAAGGTVTIAGVGALTIGSNGAFTFTPAAGYAGTVPSATYTVSDGALTATATLAITLDRPSLVANGNFTSSTANWTGTGIQVRGVGNFGVELSPTSGNIAAGRHVAGLAGQHQRDLAGHRDDGGRDLHLLDRLHHAVHAQHGRQVHVHRRCRDPVHRDHDQQLGPLFHLLHGGDDRHHDQAAVGGSLSGTFAGVDDTGGGLVDNVQVQELNVTPTGPLAAVEDTEATFTGFEVATNAGGVLTVTLSAANGVLTLAGTAGLTFTVGSGTADQTMTFSGAASAISTALMTLRYTANANFSGADTITQTVTSGATTDTETVAVNIAAVNDAPTGANDVALAAEGQAATGNVLTNDGDIDGDPLSVTQFVWGGVTTAAGGTATLAGVGTLTIAANGAYTFTPAAGYAGAVPAATYTLSDGSLTATATLSFTLDAVNDAPSGADRTITLAEDGSHAFTAADFGFTDPNDSPANGLKAVVITTLPTKAR